MSVSENRQRNRSMVAGIFAYAQQIVNLRYPGGATQTQLVAALREAAQGMAARSDETPEAAQPVGQQPGPQDAPGDNPCP